MAPRLLCCCAYSPRVPGIRTLKNYYRVLKVDSTADEATIKAAFRRLARRHHPDLAKDARAARRFPEIREAYEVLSDPQKRRRYDQLSRARMAVRPGAGGADGRNVQARPRAASAGVGITLNVLGLRVGLALDAAARRSSGANRTRRRQRRQR
jgi:DnaJ-class molecular chaperone